MKYIPLSIGYVIGATIFSIIDGSNPFETVPYGLTVIILVYLNDKVGWLK